MTGGGALLALALAAPVAALLALLSPSARPRIPILLALAPAPAVLAALFASGDAVVLPRALLGMTLALDMPGAILLGASALLWIAAGAAAGARLAGDPADARFAAWWLLTLTGSLGVFMAADLVSFYFVYALVSLPAYWLVVRDATTDAWRAGSVYIAMAILGEAFLLMAFVLLAAGEPGGSLLIRDVVAALPGSPWRDAALALLIAGFGTKIGLVPLHFWMPLAYTAAPVQAAAALSGAAVKAGVIGLIRFLPLAAALPGWGEGLAAVGLVGAFCAVAAGITQTNPKTVLAYSSVSQMGVIAAVLGMMLASGGAGLFGVSLYAAHHALVKGGLFLALGAARERRRNRTWIVMAPAGVVALGLAGLPLTGGALAKYAIKAPLGEGVFGFLATLSAAGTTLLMLHFLARLAATSPRQSEPDPPAARAIPWLATALACVAVPWLLFLTVGGGSLSDAFAPEALWDALWPMLLGGGLALALLRGRTLPSMPAGDIIVLAPHLGRMGAAASAAMERADEFLRRWPVAGLSLLAITALLFAMARPLR